MRTEVTCPAGAETHPILSPNPVDVVCRIAGGLRPGRERLSTSRFVNGDRAVCCADYTLCRVWRTAKDVEGGPSTKAQRDQIRSPERPHALRDAEREHVRVG